jgi:2-methylcitrate dehydratase PrpD
MAGTGTTRELATFVADLTWDDLPDEVARRTEDLFLDWFASTLAGKGARPVCALERFAEMMGPSDGPSEVLVSRKHTSPYFAAMINAAASHVVEQDDVHNGAVFHPGTVVFPPVLAMAQQRGSSGRDLIVASVAGYEAGIRVGEFLGRSHYKVFHTTGTAGTLASAAAVSRLLGHDADTTLHALGSAGTQAAGLWEFLRDAADSKQLHTAKAATDGLLAACVARDGLTGASAILEGPQGMAAGMSTDADPASLVDGLGTRWALLETSFKYHASCRHTHPAADALLSLMREHDLTASDISHVHARVHQAAVDVLGPVTDPRTVHQSKFSMGFVLALAALRGHAGIGDFTDDALADPDIRAFHDKVEMILDPDIDAAYPRRWVGLVEVDTRNGQHLTARVDVPKGDPGNPLTRSELEDKARLLAGWRDAASPREIDQIIARVWWLADEEDVRGWVTGNG